MKVSTNRTKFHTFRWRAAISLKDYHVKPASNVPLQSPTMESKKVLTLFLSHCSVNCAVSQYVQHEKLQQFSFLSVLLHCMLAAALWYGVQQLHSVK